MGAHLNANKKEIHYGDTGSLRNLKGKGKGGGGGGILGKISMQELRYCKEPRNFTLFTS